MAPLPEGGDVEENKLELRKLIRKHMVFADPLVRFAFDISNTTAAERRAIYKAANIFVRRGPNVASGPLRVFFTGVQGLNSKSWVYYSRVRRGNPKD